MTPTNPSIERDIEELLKAMDRAQKRAGSGRLRLAFLEDFPVELCCPQCGHRVMEILSRLKDEKSYNFPCGHGFDLGDFARDVAVAEEVRDQLKRDFEKPT